MNNSNKYIYSLLVLCCIVSCYKNSCPTDNRKYYKKQLRKQLINSFFKKKEAPKVQLDTTSNCKGELMHSDTSGTTIYNCVEVEVFSDSLEIIVADFGKEDDDTVSIQLNQFLIAKKIRLANNPTQLRNQRKWGFYLYKSKPNFLYYYAHNEGSIPPNTAFIYLNDGVIKQAIAIGAKTGTYGRLIINCRK